MTKFVLKQALGVFCLVVGFVGLVAPVIPGALFIFVGLELLGLIFLLPRPVRELYEKAKMAIVEKWRGWHEKHTRRFRRKRG